MAIARYHADFFALTVESTYTFSMGTHRVYNFNCCTAMASLEGDVIYYFKSGQTNEICRVSADSCQPKTLKIAGDGPNPSTIFYYSWITADQMLVLSRLCDSDDMVTAEILNLRYSRTVINPQQLLIQSDGHTCNCYDLLDTSVGKGWRCFLSNSWEPLAYPCWTGCYFWPTVKR